MKKRKPKGQYGYRDYHKKIQICKVIFGLLMILAQLGARNFTDNQALKNILTVMAVLTVLPTANVASPLIASWKYRTPPMSFYEAVSVYENQFPILYDLVITSKEAIMPMDAVIVHPTGIYAYLSASRADPQKGESYLNGMLTTHKLDANARIIGDEKTFLQRLKSLKPVKEYEDDGSVSYAMELLKQLSM